MIKVEEKIKQSREEIQNKAFKLSFNNHFMVLQYPTGLGKSYTMIKIIERVLNANSSYNCLILEEEIAVINNLKEEFIKFDKEYLLDRCNIICYKSLHKVKEYYDIIVLDEAHHAFSDLRLDWFQKMKVPKYMYLLSATLETYQIKTFEKVVGANFLVHKVALKKAIEWGILPTPKIGIFKLELNDKDINCFYEYKRGKKELQQTIICEKEQYKWKYIKDKIHYPNINLIVYCTEKQKYNQLCYQAESAKSKYLEDVNNEELKKYWFYSELCIKRFLSEIKTPYLDEFLQDVIKEGNKFLCFFGSVSQAEELAKKHGTNLVAAKNKQSQELIKKFNNNEIKNLYCCRMLSEGLTLTNLDVGIISQLDGKANNFIQKCGRVLRNQIRPYLYIFYYKDTKDEEYLEGALKKIDKDYITYLDYFLN